MASAPPRPLSFNHRNPLNTTQAMKKAYICPSSIVMGFHTEHMIATSSLGVSEENAEQWSNRNGSWNASNWSETSEDAE